MVHELENCALVHGTDVAKPIPSCQVYELFASGKLTRILIDQEPHVSPWKEEMGQCSTALGELADVPAAGAAADAVGMCGRPAERRKTAGMMSREKSCGIGARLPVKHCQGAYPLPEGLAAGTIVTVIEFEIGRGNVRTDDGREWNVAMQNIDGEPVKDRKRCFPWQ